MSRPIYHPAQILAPLLVVPGSNGRTPIEALPDNYRVTSDKVADEGKILRDLGIGGVVVYGVAPERTEFPTPEHSLCEESIALLKQAAPSLTVVADLCVCHMTTHGHCGVVDHGEVNNDLTLELLSQRALRLARAGADLLMPSAMADGLVIELRTILDSQGFQKVGIISQAVKQASALYAPYRTATLSTTAREIRKESYQVSSANPSENIREALIDSDEGADIILVKPAHGNGDLISTLSSTLPIPVGAFVTSGEYGMLCAGVEQGVLPPSIFKESVDGLVRAGASVIVTYAARRLTR